MDMRYRVALFVLLAAIYTARAEAQFNIADPAPGETYDVELAFMWWQPTPELLVQTDALAAINETEIDFVGEFGLEKERFREFRAVLKPGRKHKVRFSYVPISYAAETLLQRSITFGGVTYDVGLPANAAVDWKLWRIGYEYDFAVGDRGFVGMIVEGKYNQISALLDTQIGSSVAEVDTWVPTLGVIARGYVHRTVSVTAEFTGFKVPDFIADRFKDEGEFKAQMSDFDIYATASISRFFGLQGGYRSLTADYEIDEDSADLKLKGPYFGLMVRF
jgi:hypothetical protein